MNKSLITLLSENPKVCKALHDMSNIDWQQPVSVTEYTGKFTHKSICKEIKNLTEAEHKDCNVFLLYKNPDAFSTWRSKQLFVAEVKPLEFRVLPEEIRGYKGISYTYNIESEFRKSDFEAARKSGKLHYWLVIQERNKENHRQYIYDRTARHPECKDGIDKSGYIISDQRNAYYQRVQKIKAEKSAAAASVWDGRQVIREFEDRIEAIQDIIRSHLFARTIPDYTGISDATRQLQYAVDHIRRLKENRFTAIEDIQREIRWTNDYISKAENRMKE